ncbi:hypothetical protein KMW28_24390 [Flammeovirga yaeyamensis]|uniref:Uncharacterized protein n=1 Tax=Flammeovirga yaeyamensis TaxID=367791 RepID=A0AAX1N8Y1_9BACT|nr:hypothetical protein [Flammeovirga yaeyamensis]MBB3699575.1 hypothetical protein [Flammeovirga yaeyamensis]NMF35170.1 hypothetical protein [Flammeovirga yaeyamensis]QWG04034.1 hypothetical protein KMW28_24390 [Flammeovirga yaeyamensis]
MQKKIIEELKLPSEIKSLIKDQKFEEAKQLLKKKYISRDLIEVDDLISSNENESNIIIKNYRKIIGQLIDVKLLILALFSGVIVLFNDEFIFFFLVSILLIIIDLAMNWKQFSDKSTKITINENFIIFHYLENEKIKFSNLLTIYAKKIVRGNRTKRSYFYLTFIYKDPNMHIIEINISGLELDCFEIGKILKSKLLKY